MKNIIHYFTSEQGNLLIRIILAHLLADFVLQSNKMVINKKYFSYEMCLHIIIVFITTLLFSQSLIISVFVAISHYCIDAFKIFLQTKYQDKNLLVFVLDQVFHILSIIVIWALLINMLPNLWDSILLPVKNYTISLYLLAYTVIIWPVGYLLKFVLQKMALDTDTKNVEHGGKLIGQFERIIILTFVLLGQYEAIGFLITGKSIIRFADKNSDVKSEYVLVGTMMSYAIAILTGVCVNWLIIIAK